jgi:hypothetical protein
MSRCCKRCLEVALPSKITNAAKSHSHRPVKYLPLRAVSRRSPLHNATEFRHSSSPPNVQSGQNGFQLRCVAGHLYQLIH